MSTAEVSSVLKEPTAFTKASVVNGESVDAKCLDIGGQTYIINGGLVKVAGLEDDWFEDVADPQSIVRALRTKRGSKPDIFTFWQRLPDVEPRYPFYLEYESIAALRVESYEYWLKKQVKADARNKVRKSVKAGVEVREVAFDDEFVRGMVTIFNETPVRQGRRFWHYGKDFETVKRQFSRFISREDVIGAYYRDELIGFVLLGDAGKYGVLGQIVSMVQHRDKAPNNALIAKAVEVCVRKKLSYLVYAFWADSSLADFKRHSGFEEVRLPRYFVPITPQGKLALRLGVHRDWKMIIPARIKKPLKELRSKWYVRQSKRSGTAA